MEEQNGTTNEISQSVADASEGSCRIAINVGEVVDGAEKSRDSVNNMDSAMVELASMATELEGLVADYRLAA